MVPKMFIIAVYFCLCFIENVFGQVCVDTKMNWRDVPETYLYTYLEAYEKSDCLFWCTGTRVATAVGTRTVQKQVAEKINVCCEGYAPQASNTDNSLHCQPVCSPPCRNGYCKSPGECACNPGYLISTYDSHSCDPLCIKGCEHGICRAPNTCECDGGYENLEDICEPICYDPCDNGICVAPNTCQCLPGYKKSDNGICEPYCSSYTASGECINTTTCEPGWIKVTKGSLETCQPVCAEPCVNGTCIAPDTCECLDGYKESVLGTCEPFCSSGCPQGRCIGPETCVCEAGWFIKEPNGACVAHCDQTCGNGLCVAPNVCECFPGYMLDESRLLEHSPLCVPVCENCEKPCIDPENCICPWPETAMRATAAGEPCSHTEDNCERTICIMTTTTTTLVTTPEDKAMEVTTTPQDVITTETLADEATTTDYIGTTGSSIDNEYYELKIEKASWYVTLQLYFVLCIWLVVFMTFFFNRLSSEWFYGIGSVLLIIIFVVLIAAILKRKCSKSFDNNMFGSKGDDLSAVVHYKQTSMP